MNADRAARPPGTGHGAVLTLCVVVPITTAVARAARLRIEGFPVWGFVALVGAVAVAYGLLAVVGARAGHHGETPGVASARPGLGGVGARVLAAALLAIAVRLTVPSPARAFAEVRDGDAFLVSGTAILVFFGLLFAAITGQVVTTRVVVLARGQRSVALTRAVDRLLVVSAWGTGLLLVLVAGLTRGSGGLLGQLVTLAAIVVAVATLGDLRTRMPPPGGLRPPIVAVVAEVRGRALAGALAAVVVGTLVLVPLLPDALYAGLGRPSEWLADLEFELAPGGSTSSGEGGEFDPLLERLPIEEWGLPEWPELREIRIPGWVPVVAVAVVGLAGLAVLRPDRWIATWRRLVAALRGSGRGAEDDGFERLDPLEDLTGGPSSGRHRLRDALERFRPRPRDPRQAIVHDYLGIDRLLAREGLGRQPAETPLEHAERVVAARDDRVGCLRDLAALVSVARYAASAPDVAAADRSRDLHQRLEDALR